jgi:hypothetical protein
MANEKEEKDKDNWQNTTEKTKDYRLSNTNPSNPNVPEVSAPLVAPVMLLLLKIQDAIIPQKYTL